MTFLKSIGAVVAGFAVVVILSTLIDFLAEAAGFFPGSDHPELMMPWMLGIALAYRLVVTVAGGYITAWLAPHSPWRHVYILLALGLLGGIAGVFAGWSYGNHWYPIALAALSPFAVWTGGWLRINRN